MLTTDWRFLGILVAYTRSRRPAMGMRALCRCADWFRANAGWGLGAGGWARRTAEGVAVALLLIKPASTLTQATQPLGGRPKPRPRTDLVAEKIKTLLIGKDAGMFGPECRACAERDRVPPLTEEECLTELEPRLREVLQRNPE